MREQKIPNYSNSVCQNALSQFHILQHEDNTLWMFKLWSIHPAFGSCQKISAARVEKRTGRASGMYLDRPVVHWDAIFASDLQLARCA